MKTSDIFGKHLAEFAKRDDQDNDDVPLIFWLLAGFFRVKEKRGSSSLSVNSAIGTEGIFNRSAEEAELMKLELHMS